MVYLDGEEKEYVEQNNPQTINNVQCFASHGGNIPIYGQIRNVEFTQGEKILPDSK